MSNLEHRVRKLEQEAQAPSEEATRDARFWEMCRQKAAELSARLAAQAWEDRQP